MKTIAIVSGGLDSVTLVYHLHSGGHDLALVSFDYGQRHRKELSFASYHAGQLGLKHQIIDVSQVGRLLRGSALTDNVSVPDGHYQHENMRLTVVPNRNAIMLAIAFAVAASEHANTVAFAAHSGDHFIYPDCRPDFVAAFNEMEQLATAGLADVRLLAPFIRKSKADIVGIGARLGVPYQQTWSCYKGGEIHCGRCGTCVERKEAFSLATVPDPTTYADAEFMVPALR